MNQNTFCMAGGVARNPLVRLAKPITATIGANEHIAIVGPNGGGKSLFVDTLIGKYPLREGTVQYDFSPSATQTLYDLSLIHISEPTRLGMISYAVFCLKKKKKKKTIIKQKKK